MKILTLDGGPGPAFAIRILEGVERRHPGFLESVELFSGTSDGALMSLYLAQALTRKQAPMEAIQGCIEFNEKLLRMFQARPTNWLRLLSGSHALFDGREFYELMQRTFGDMVLADLQKKVVVFGFDASHRRTEPFFVFKPGHHPSATLVDVALATSAFPLVLPGYIANKGRGMGQLVMDGALTSNSVGMATLMGAADFLTEKKQGLLTTGYALPQLKFLSMGLDPVTTETWLAGWLKRFLPGGVVDRLTAWRSGLGLRPVHWKMDPAYRGGMTERGWLWFVVNVLPSMVTLLQGTTASDVSNLRQLLGPKHFFRFDPKVDAASLVVNNLFSSDATLQAITRWVEQFWTSEDDEIKFYRAGLLEWITESWFSEESGAASAPAA